MREGRQWSQSLISGLPLSPLEASVCRNLSVIFQIGVVRNLTVSHVLRSDSAPVSADEMFGHANIFSFRFVAKHTNLGVEHPGSPTSSFPLLAGHLGPGTHVVIVIVRQGYHIVRTSETVRHKRSGTRWCHQHGRKGERHLERRSERMWRGYSGQVLLEVWTLVLIV